MTNHIDQATVMKLAEEKGVKFDPGFGTCFTGNVELTSICNAAIQHYIDGLKAELPEPVGYTTPDVVRLLSEVPCVTTQLVKNKHDPIRGKQIALYTADQVAQILAAERTE